ncbi:MAG: DUF512 domain-containing protein [Bacillota bacterium]|jgi:putative radical SAM enzyme (TIGR03279 family)
MYGQISDIIPGSIAEELGIVSGEKLVGINGHAILDIIDYGYYCNDEELLLEVKDLCGETYFCQVEKEAEEDLGLCFASNLFDGMRSCCNKCLFCFMEQLPPHARKSLLVKDDDYRMSFLQGNYITGTNLLPKDIERIEKLKLSPLYFSIHCSDLQMRRQLLGNQKADDIIPLLKRLCHKDIVIHGQIVLCPGLNDGQVLEKTLADLEGLGSNLQSVALVPVGLTKYQKNDCLRLYTKEEAQHLISFINKQQASYRKKRGSSFVFLADEFYIMADELFPDYEHYEEFPQLENGVGMCRILLDDWQRVKKDLPAQIAPKKEFLFITGKSAEKLIRSIADDLSFVDGLKVNVMSVENKFFGSSITVAGLLTVTCIKEALAGNKDLPTLILPSTMLKFDQNIFLDNGTLEQLRKDLQTEIMVIEPCAEAILRAVCG